MSLPVKPEHLEADREWRQRSAQKYAQRRRVQLDIQRDGDKTVVRREPQRRVKPVSDKRAAQLAEYRPKRDAFLAERPFCERCGKPRTCLHHKRGRRGLLLLDERWWAASCTECNDLPESQTGLARAEGWLLDQFTDLPEGDAA